MTNPTLDRSEKRAYVGVKDCGCVTAILVDDDITTPEDVAKFAKDLSKSGRKMKNVPLDEGKKLFGRCRCGK